MLILIFLDQRERTGPHIELSRRSGPGRLELVLRHSCTSARISILSDITVVRVSLNIHSLL